MNTEFSQRVFPKVVGLLVLSLLFSMFTGCGFPKRMGYDRELGGWPISGAKIKRTKAYSSKIKNYKAAKIFGLKRIIKPWIGTPYLWGGSQKQVGTDCSGFVQSVMSEYSGLILPRTSGQMYDTGISINKSKLKPGDLVFFGPGWSVNHVGIYTGNNHFSHASSSNGVEYSDLDNSYWARRYKGARRYD